MNGMKKEFWEIVCDFEMAWRTALALLLMFAVLLGVSLPFIEKDTSAYYITGANVVLLVPLLAVTLFVLRKCERQ